MIHTNTPFASVRKQTSKQAKKIPNDFFFSVLKNSSALQFYSIWTQFSIVLEITTTAKFLLEFRRSPEHLSCVVILVGKCSFCATACVSRKWYFQLQNIIFGICKPYLISYFQWILALVLFDPEEKNS